MGAYRYWWHYSGIVKRTQSIFGRAMPIPWIEITKEMYDDFLSAFDVDAFGEGWALLSGFTYELPAYRVDVLL